MIKIRCDFETQSECNLKKAGAYEYAAHPSTRAMSFAFKRSDRDKAYLFDFYQMQKPFSQLSPTFQATLRMWLASPDVVFTAHNAYFEQCIFNVTLARLGWPAIPPKKWRCNAAKAAACAIPRNLADAGAVMQVAAQKDFEGHRIMMKLCKPTPAWNKWNRARLEIKNGGRVGAKKREIAAQKEPLKFFTPREVPEDFKKLYHYNKIDVYSEESLDNALPDLTPFEQKLWVIDQKINLRGVKIDTPLVKKISKIMHDESKSMVRDLDILTMGLVSSGNARAAILDFLTLEGIELPDLRAKTVSDFLENGKATGDAKKLLEIRRALSKSSTAKYAMFILRSISDGRVRDLLLFHAASTGRWGGKGIQPQNMPRGIIKDIWEAIHRIKTCTLEELKMLYGENLMPLFSSVLRGMFIASDGHEMFVEDYSAIECRVTWWLAGHEKGLQMFRDGRDPYKEMASKIYRKSVLDISDEERQVGKAAVLGCGYQMGGRKFVTSAWDVYRAKVDSDMAKVAVSVYREVHSPVVEMWDAYQNACIFAIENKGQAYRVGRVKFFTKGKFLFIELPSGRRLAYADPKIIIEDTLVFVGKDGESRYAGTPKMVQDCKDKGYTYVNKFSSKKFAYMAVNQMAKKADCDIPKWSLERTYGGKIVENVVQAVSRDILAEGIVRVTEAGFNVLFHSHDELVSEAPKGRFSQTQYRDLLERLPEWADGLPLKSSGWTGTRYKKG